MKNPINRTNLLSSFLLFLAVLLLFINLVQVSKLYRRAWFHDPLKVFYPPGFEFTEFKIPLKSVETAGFLTDKDMSPERNDGTFLQAQYALTPTVLKLGSPDHPYIVLDCLSMLNCFEIMNQVNARPIGINQYGKILAKRDP